MSTDQILLRDIEAFLRETGMAATTFSRKAAGDLTLVERLRAGRTITQLKGDEIRAWMRENRHRRAA